MSIIGKARAKVKTARGVYAKYQAEAGVRKVARETRQREKVEEQQHNLAAELKRINGQAASREKTNKLKRDIVKARQRKQVAYRGLPKRKAPRITPKTPRLRR